MKIKSRFLVALAALSLIGGAALSQSISVPQVSSINPGDLFQDIVNGQPQPGNVYASASVLAAYTRAQGGGSWEQNLIDNSDFSVDQVNAGASMTVGTSLGRAVDRWYSIYTVSSSGGTAPATIQGAVSSGLTLTTDELKLTTSGTATTSSTAGMITRIQQTVEASDMEDLQWGQTPVTGQQQPTPVTVSLWLKSSIASANIGVSLKGASSVQSYVNDCVLSATASTWTLCSFTVPAPTTGTWSTAIGAAGPVLDIAAQCGSTFQTASPNSWQTGTYYCTAAQTQQLGTASATLEIAAVKMQRGLYATQYGAPAYAVEFPKLRRYYASTFPVGTAPASSAGVGGALEFFAPSTVGGTIYWRFPSSMYASPTVTAYNPSASGSGCRDITNTGNTLTGSVDPDSAKSVDGVLIYCSGTTTAADHVVVHLTADAGI